MYSMAIMRVELCFVLAVIYLRLKILIVKSIALNRLPISAVVMRVYQSGVEVFC